MYVYQPDNHRWPHRLDLAETWGADADCDKYDGVGRWSDPAQIAKRDGIVAAMKLLPQYSEEAAEGTGEHDEDLWWIVDEMTDVTYTDHFNQVWEGFYDWADLNGVWVGIHGRRS